MHEALQLRLNLVRTVAGASVTPLCVKHRVSTSSADRICLAECSLPLSDSLPTSFSLKPSVSLAAALPVWVEF